MDHVLRKLPAFQAMNNILEVLLGMAGGSLSVWPGAWSISLGSGWQMGHHEYSTP